MRINLDKYDEWWAEEKEKNEISKAIDLTQLGAKIIIKNEIRGVFMISNL